MGEDIKLNMEEARCVPQSTARGHELESRIGVPKGARSRGRT